MNIKKCKLIKCILHTSIYSNIMPTFIRKINVCDSNVFHPSVNIHMSLYTDIIVKYLDKLSRFNIIILLKTDVFCVTLLFLFLYYKADELTLFCFPLLLQCLPLKTFDIHTSTLSRINRLKTRLS